MVSSKVYAFCVMALVLSASSLPACTAATATIRGPSARKLLQPRSATPWALNSNTLRAQAATSQSIEEAVNRGGGVVNTRRAGMTGVATAWASGQRNDIYNTADFAFSPGRAG